MRHEGTTATRMSHESKSISHIYEYLSMYFSNGEHAPATKWCGGEMLVHSCLLHVSMHYYIMD